MSEVEPPKPRREAAAKSNTDFMCIETYSCYRESARDPQGAQHLLPPEASDEELGAALLDALARSRFLTLAEADTFFFWKRIKDSYDAWVKYLMDRHGYKTKRALFKNMKNCRIESQEGKITIRPTNHEKLEGWTGDGLNEEDYVVIPADSLATEVGAALRLAFSRCI
jgi:hypothetical protein